MYVAVKGGEQAIDNAHRLLAKKRRGDTAVPELSVEQIRQQLPLAVARVMSEGSLYDEELAALAIKQAAGDLVEAIFLLRAYRTTLPRFSIHDIPIHIRRKTFRRPVAGRRPVVLHPVSVLPRRPGHPPFPGGTHGTPYASPAKNHRPQKLPPAQIHGGGRQIH